MLNHGGCGTYRSVAEMVRSGWCAGSTAMQRGRRSMPRILRSRTRQQSFVRSRLTGRFLRGEPDRLPCIDERSELELPSPVAVGGFACRPHRRLHYVMQRNKYLQGWPKSAKAVPSGMDCGNSEDPTSITSRPGVGPVTVSPCTRYGSPSVRLTPLDGEQSMRDREAGEDP